MSAASSDPRKRSKKRYAAGSRHSGKRWRGCRELEVGMQGILITCNMNERKCTAEAFNLLNEYADELLGPEKVGFREALRVRRHVFGAVARLPAQVRAERSRPGIQSHRNLTST